MVDYLIVGGGIAGFTAAKTLRNQDRKASVVLVTDEPFRPYKRTRLSKEWATGLGPQDYALDEPDWYRESGVELMTQVQVLGLQPQERTLTLGDGRKLSYGKLLLALGAEGPAGGLRTALDAESLRKTWHRQGKAVILGAGILGVEMAEQGVLSGLPTTLGARNGRLLSRELPLEFSLRLERVLKRKGIEIVDSVEPRDWNLRATGSVPRKDLAVQGGLLCDQGILVNQEGRTSDPHIWAAGDCAQNPFGLCHLWHQAEDQGKTAALSMAGLPVQPVHRPYRIKLEVFGDYFFSLAPSSGQPLGDLRLPGQGSGEGIWQSWWGTPEGVTGVVMAGDKERNKLYEKAVLEGWTWERVKMDLGR